MSIVALLVNLAVAWWNVDNLTRTQEEFDKTRTNQGKLREFLSTIKDAETGQRGYVLTANKEYLEPFTEASEHITQQYQALHTSLQNDAIQRERLDQLWILAQKKMNHMAGIVEQARLNRTDEARHPQRHKEGKEMMDRIRRLVAEMDAHEEKQRIRQADALQLSRTIALATSLGGGLLALSIVGLAFVLVRAELKRRSLVEGELRESEASFRVLAEVMPQMVWMTHSNGDHAYYNQRWYEYTGLSQLESQAQGWSNPLHPDDRERTRSHWKQALDTGRPYETEYRLRRADGEYRWFLARAQPQRDERNRVLRWIGTSTDIDASKRATEVLEEEVRKRTAELVGANVALRQEIADRARAEEFSQVLLTELKRSNESLEQFAYVASHDLQEPLRKIQAFGDLLGRKYGKAFDEQGTAYVERMVSSATRMRTLIDDLLTYSRVSTRLRATEEVNLSQLVDGVLSDLDNQITRTGGTVHVASLPTIQGDPVQMRQLFQNLIGNALKFHHPERPPEVYVEAEPQTDGEERCRLTVRDNGIGFEEVYADRIFQMFQRLHGRGEYEGTGMGLAICRKIAERHGGSITVRSKVNEGTTFIVEMPLRSVAPV